MKISVVTPVFNEPRIRRALESVFAQQHEHEIESVVIDAGSADGTLDILKEFEGQISTLVCEPDKGIYDGMNKGIRNATGDVIGILNADDQYHDPFVIRDVMDAFGGKEDLATCYGDLMYHNEDGKLVRYWRAGNFRRAKWYFGWMPPHPTFFVRRCVYERHGAFDLGYPIAADYELMLRLLLKHGISVKYLRRVVVNMAPGGASNASVGTILKANLEVARAWRNNGLRGGLLVPVLKPAQKAFQLVSRP